MKRSLNIPFVNFIFALFLSVSVLIGCGGSSPGGNGGGTPPSQAPVLPTVLSLSPEPDAIDVPVEAVVEMTFSKSMDPASFTTGLEGFRHPDDQFACVDSDCKIIRFMPGASFDYGTRYTLKLQTGASGVKDKDGKTFAAPIEWSFTTFRAESLAPDAGFQLVTIEGGGVRGIADAGECTSVGVETNGTVHIAYLSASESRPKHAFCRPTQDSDCSKPEHWEIEFIDHPTSHGLGRDINMVIDSLDQIHVSYRDYCGNCNNPASPDDNLYILKYATKINGVWKSIVVDDTTHKVTDTYIKVDKDGRIHISYRRNNWDNSAGSVVTSLAYATCSHDCFNPSAWSKVDIDGGSEVGNNDFATPSFIFVADDAVHISYHANGTLKYAACPLAGTDGCREKADWSKVVVDVDAAGEVGTDSSISVDGNGIHITYRHSTKGDLKYAHCASACMLPGNWEKAAIDTVGDIGVCTQLKIDASGGLHVIYADRTNRDVKYGHCREDCLNPGNWSLFRVDHAGEVGWDGFLALGPDGKVHISYRDRGNTALKYAWGKPPLKAAL